MAETIRVRALAEFRVSLYRVPLDEELFAVSSPSLTSKSSRAATPAGLNAGGTQLLTDMSIFTLAPWIFHR